MPEDFKVKVGEFEGPMALLLQLVEDKKLHISQVSLAAVTDDFIAHLKAFAPDKHELADFILVAATLMLIKSRALLPGLTVSAEEEESMADLERRLKLYERARALGEHIKERWNRAPIFEREAPRTITPTFAPSAELTTPNLLQVLKNLINNLPKVEKLPEVIVRKVISLEEAIGDLTRRVESALRMSFKQLVKDKTDRVNIIVSFLGMLELVKQGVVQVEQQAHFDDIQIESAQASVPKYL